MSSREWWSELDPWGYLEETYLGDPNSWPVLAAVVRAAGVCGLDTEFYGLDVRKESCVGRARVHVWSIAVSTKRRSPLGFHHAVGWVLPVAALLHPDIKGVLEDPAIEKDIHNQPVDDHAVNNHGVEIVGCVNTLDYSRWRWPWLVTAGGFGLKNLMQVKLRRDPICEFKDVVSDVRQIEVTKIKRSKKTVCSCEAEGCRKRKPEESHVKTKVEVAETVVALKDEEFEHPLESIVPGHKRWELLVAYAAEDSIAARQTKELADNEKNPAPYPYTPGLVITNPRNFVAGPRPRPLFNQAVCDAVVLMEREGFPVDVEYCHKVLNEVAGPDEEKELVWLHKWFVVNGALTYGPHRREGKTGVDAIWSSPTKLAVMFDGLDFPRSPIWKKGKVKPGDIKLDSTALKWIARNCPDAKQMIGHLLQLKKIRAGKKYLLKLGNSGGWVNVICGPAGDSDDRNGAVTGRLGIKGTLEAQQLPTKEEVDLYHIRKAIVAEDMRTSLVRADVCSHGNSFYTNCWDCCMPDEETNEASNLRVA